MTVQRGDLSKRKHHYVPRFYLKGFASLRKRINLCNLETGISVQHASLKDQCYKERFYGPTNETEDNLAFVENQIAPVLQRMRAANALPTAEGREWLFAFVTLQLLRTTVAAKRINSSTDKVMKQVHSQDSRLAGIDLDSVNVGYDDPVLTSLKNLPQLLLTISDLVPHLIVSPTAGFITSDNPAFKYNQYCEGIDYTGVTGGLRRGLQIFLPLSPHLHLILYDAGVYKIEDRHRGLSIASQNDVDTLNALQLVSADQNAYFSKWEHADAVRRLLPKVLRHRKTDPVRVVEYGQDDDVNSSILHEFDRMPDLQLRLSFLTFKRKARKVSLYDRAQKYRKDLPMPPYPGPPSLQGRSVTFSRFLGER